MYEAILDNGNLKYSEKTECPNMTLVNGEYKGKAFVMSYYLDGSSKIRGNFTDEQKKDLLSIWLSGGL